MFTPDQLEEIEAYILESLPRVLEQDQRFALAVERVVSEKYAAKSDLALILQEIKVLREDMDRRFETLQKEIDKRFEAFQEQLDQRFQAFRKEMNQQFEAFQEQMDQRFQALQEQIDRRFEATNQRLDEHDQRFDQIDQRLDEHDHRFDQIDQRFDQIDQKLEDLQSWVGVVVGGFQNRAGKSLENALAGMLRIALKNPDVREDTIQVRRKLTDHEGVMGVPGKDFEFDIFVQDGELIVFEVKSGSDVEMVEYFAQKRPIVERAFPDKQVKMVFITLAPAPAIADACAREGVILAK